LIFNILATAANISKKRGIRYAFHYCGFYTLLYFCYNRKVRRHNTFIVRGNCYHYFDSFGNNTWHNERSVEVPIVMEMVRKYRGRNFLEVGNVLSNFFRFEHDIVDKYETARGVINEDVVDFESDKKYDLIVSISTLEHVGWDENPRDDMKIPRAIENLKTLIKSRGGTILITLPLAHNRDLDRI
jgi:hypothetical protein